MDWEEQVSAGVLALGGGIAGCYAVVAAARKGKKVVLVEKGVAARNGAAGSGLDHWESVRTNPCSKVMVEETANVYIDEQDGYSNGIAHYIEYQEGWYRLKDMESSGGRIRDTQGEFTGVDLRDEKMDLMFACDYENKSTVWVWGSTFKPTLYKELERLGVTIYDRTEATVPLTAREDGTRRCIGAMGTNVHTAKFLIFNARTTILIMSRPAKIWLFDSDQAGLSEFRPTQSIDSDYAMGHKAGVEFTMMEESVRGESSVADRSFLPCSAGNNHNTWHAATMVDVRGMGIPYIDRDGKEPKTVKERYHSAKGQRFLPKGGVINDPKYEYRGPETLEFKELMKQGYQLPFYADLSRMLDEEHRVTQGTMVGGGGKIKIPVLENFTERGFNPTKRHLQSYGARWQSAALLAQERQLSGTPGGIFHGWDLQTSTQGFHVASDQLYASDCCGFAAATGYYTGRKAAAVSNALELTALDRADVNRKRKRLYASFPVEDGTDWRELDKVISKAMQSYYGGVKSDMLLMQRLELLESYEKEYIPALSCANPYKPTRTHEVMNTLEVCKLILNACLLRESSSTPLCFEHSDYPQMDPQEGQCFVTICQGDGKIYNGRVLKRYYGDVKSQYKTYNQDCIREEARVYEEE